MAVTYQVINDVLDAIKVALEARFTELSLTVTVLTDNDEPTEARVLELATDGPTVVVAWAGTKSGTYGTKNRAIHRFAAGVWAGPVPGDPEDEITSAIRVVTPISLIIADLVLGNDWDVDGVDRADTYQSDNMTGGTPETEGFALATVEWEHRIEFPVAVDPSTLEDLETVYTTATLNDAIEPETTDEFATEIEQE